MTLHKELKRVRKECGKTQKEFAKLIGVSREHYCSIETGRSTPTLDLLKKVDSVTGKQLVITYIDKL